MTDAVRIRVKKDELSLEGIRQFMSPLRRRSGSLTRSVIRLKHPQSQPTFMAAMGGTSVRGDSDRLRVGFTSVSTFLFMFLMRLMRCCLVVSKIRSTTFFNTLPFNIQVCLFSATMPPEIWDLTTEFMRDAVRILVKKDDFTLEGIRQSHVAIEEEWELDTLCDLYGTFTRLHWWNFSS